MAENLRGVPFDGVICSVMDARCRQVYTACFDGASLDRLTPDEAISLEDLKIRLLSYKKTIFLVGDGAAMCYTNLEGQVPELLLAPVPLRFQRAAGVAACAWPDQSPAWGAVRRRGAAARLSAAAPGAAGTASAAGGGIAAYMNLRKEWKSPCQTRLLSPTIL